VFKVKELTFDTVWLTLSSIKPILAKIKDTDFRLSVDIERQALNDANEF
jgi:hypothetical protein